MTTDRLARIVVHLYPRAWRARYQDEVLALLDERPPTSRDVVDLVASCAWQWTGAVLRWSWSWIDPACRLVAATLVFTVPALVLSRGVRAAIPGGWDQWLLGAAGLAWPALMVRLIVPFRRRTAVPRVNGLGLVRLRASETRIWRKALFVCAILHFASRPHAFDGQAIFGLVVGFPGLAFWFLNMYSDKPLFMRPPAAPPANPLGLA